MITTTRGITDTMVIITVGIMEDTMVDIIITIITHLILRQNMLQDLVMEDFTTAVYPTVQPMGIALE